MNKHQVRFLRRVKRYEASVGWRNFRDSIKPDGSNINWPWVFITLVVFFAVLAWAHSVIDAPLPLTGEETMENEL